MFKATKSLRHQNGIAKSLKSLYRTKIAIYSWCLISFKILTNQSLLALVHQVKATSNKKKIQGPQSWRMSYVKKDRSNNDRLQYNGKEKKEYWVATKLKVFMEEQRAKVNCFKVVRQPSNKVAQLLNQG
jgi:hypothetical protein